MSSDNLVRNLATVSSEILRSDHYILSFDLFTNCSLNSSHSSNFPTFDYKNTDFDNLLSFLSDVDFSPLLNSSDIELVWSSLKELILYSISLFSPRTRITSYHSPVWFNSAICHQLNKTHSIRKQCKQNPFSRNTSKLSTAETLLQKEIFAAKAHFENNLVAFSNDSKIYQYIRSLSGRVTLPEIMYWGSSSAQTPTAKANLFNN